MPTATRPCALVAQWFGLCPGLPTGRAALG